MRSCNLKTFHMAPIRFKRFSLSRISYLRCYAKDWYTYTNVVGCNIVFYGKTESHCKVWICELLGISHLTDKKLKIHNGKLRAIQEHLWCCNYTSFFEEFSILVTESNDFRFQVIERLHIERDNLLEIYVTM